MTFGKNAKKAGPDAMLAGADFDFHEVENGMSERQQVGSQDSVRVAFGDEYVRADGFRRIGGGELQQFGTDQGEPTAQPQYPQGQNCDEKSEKPKRPTHDFLPHPLTPEAFQ
ncbi:MAG: hypothetical protein WAU78_18625 [Roseiarcus sp.]